MAQQIFETFPRDRVTDDMVAQAAKLFSENYGVWGEHSFQPVGKRVRMSAQRLRDQLLPEGSLSSYTRVFVDGRLVGHAISCRWSSEGKIVCWITQLVVHRDYRKRGLARSLLSSLMEETDDIFGVMSSHPATCMAVARSYGRGIERVSIDFIQQNAQDIIRSSPIEYVRNASLSGSLFEETSSGMISGVNTEFFVNHEEPLKFLRYIQEDGLNWLLGSLPEGYEFLLLLPRSRHRYD